jgi:hypothetical protein
MKSMRDVFQLIFDATVRAFGRRYENVQGGALGFPPALLFDGLR